MPTVFVAEEGWHLVDGTFAKVTRRNQKVARGEALMNVTALQHLSDIDAGSPAIAAIQEAETVVIYRQGKEADAARCVELFNLPPSSKQTLLELPKGTALVKVGARKPVLVTHMRSAWEQSVTDTDEAMHSAGTVSLLALNPQLAADLDPDPRTELTADLDAELDAELGPGVVA